MNVLVTSDPGRKVDKIVSGRVAPHGEGGGEFRDGGFDADSVYAPCGCSPKAKVQ